MQLFKFTAVVFSDHNEDVIQTQEMYINPNHIAVILPYHEEYSEVIMVTETIEAMYVKGTPDQIVQSMEDTYRDLDLDVL